MSANILFTIVTSISYYMPTSIGMISPLLMIVRLLSKRCVRQRTEGYNFQC